MTTSDDRARMKWKRQLLGLLPDRVSSQLYDFLWAHPKELQRVPPAFDAAERYDNTLWEAINTSWGRELGLSPEDIAGVDWQFKVGVITGAVITAMTVEGLVDVALVFPRVSSAAE